MPALASVSSLIPIAGLGLSDKLNEEKRGFCCFVFVVFLVVCGLVVFLFLWWFVLWFGFFCFVLCVLGGGGVDYFFFFNPVNLPP